MFFSGAVLDILKHRMSVSWKDERYIEHNQHRKTKCNSNKVVWTKKGEFWLPDFIVVDALKLVKFYLL